MSRPVCLSRHRQPARSTRNCPVGTPSHHLEAKMRTVLSIVTAVLLLGGSDLRADEAAAAIVRKAIMAHGGAANLDKHLTCRIESQGSAELEYSLSGVIDYTFKMELTAKPGKFKESIKIFQTINH